MEKNSSKFDFYQFFKWLAIGFTVAGFGIAVAVMMALLTGRRFF